MLVQQLAVPAGELPDIVATLPSPEADPDRWWAHERAYHRLTAGLGAGDRPVPAPDGRGPWGPWPPLPATLGPGWQWFYVHLFLAAVPGALRLHEAWGVDPAVSRATFRNIGRNVALHRELHGTPGLHAPGWLVLNVRGALFHLGRLQFLRGRAGWTTLGAPFAAGDPVLDLHIPPTGPLTPEAVDGSFSLARAFFGKHFPADDSRWGVCTSWLLDPQLRRYLPGDSNIIRFQRRFRLDSDLELPGDESIIEFVFRRVDTPLNELPRRTSLHRAVIDHLDNGGRWRMRRGWCDVRP
jgi:GNAT-like C-terminal domain/N-acyltransferase N-terminal domain